MLISLIITHAVVSLTYVYGVGASTAKLICHAVGLKGDEKIASLSEDQLDKLQSHGADMK